MRYMPDGLPSLKTYEQAKAYAESIRPYIKGRAKGSIPLGSVRRYDRSIIRVRPDSIGLFYYSNEVIRFYPDGRKLLSNCGWPSNSTASFIADVLGHHTLKQAAGKIYYVDSNYKLYKVTQHSVETPLIIDGNGNAISYATESKYVLNREAFKIIKSQYKPFLDFVRDILTLSHDVSEEVEETRVRVNLVTRIHDDLIVDSSRLRHNENKQAEIRGEFFANIRDALKLAGVDGQEKFYPLDKFYPLAKQLMVSAAVPEWDRQASKYFYFCKPTVMKEFFFKLIKFEFADAIFRKEEIQPSTTAVYDNNAKYINLKSY
jgi:hypothetical protein